MGNFETDAILAGFIALSDAAPIGAQYQCQQGGGNRFPENFDTPAYKGGRANKFDIVVGCLPNLSTDYQALSIAVLLPLNFCYNMCMWYKDGLRFECTACGRCCTGGSGYVWVSQEEIDSIAAQMGLASLIFEQVFVRTVRGSKRSLKEYPNGDCVLLSDKTRRCRVYSERPIQCRTWPFWSQNLYSPNAWKAAAATCPGCNRGKLHTLEEIEEQRKLFE